MAPSDVRSEQWASPAVSVNDPKAFQGYTLIASLLSTKTYLVDMEGRVVNMWSSDHAPGLSCYLLENGNLLRTANIWAPGEHPFGNAPGCGGKIQEFTWDGELVFDFAFSDDRYLPHHDVAKLPNGNYLMIVWERMTPEEAIAAGRNPKYVKKRGVFPDAVLEVEPTSRTTGKVVWEWHMRDHLIQDFDPTKANYGRVADHPERIDFNFGDELDVPAIVGALAGIGYLGGGAQQSPDDILQDWTHTNGIAYNAELDQIMLSVRGFSEFWIIDHSTTTEEAAGSTGGRYGKGGDLLYRWGNPRAYRAGTKIDQQLFNQHHAHWIADGLPGAGNILVFNNGTARPGGPFSSVDEIDIPVDSQGRYPTPRRAAFPPKSPLWSYMSPKRTDFYAEWISGAQRLPNGNTLICGGVNGSIFEVTSRGEIVWRYTSPVIGDLEVSKSGFIGLNAPSRADLENQSSDRGQATDRFNFHELFQKKFGGTGNALGVFDSWVFRAHRYGPEYPGLAGKDLTPGPTIEELQAQSTSRSGD